jgi:hypothetical protein
VMTAAKEAMVKMAVEEVVAVTAAADTVAVERPNRFSGGGPDVVRTNTRGAPDMKPDPKAVGKRLSAMTWSGGSSPPPTLEVLSRCSVVCHAFITDFSFFLPTLHPGFLILA